MARQVRATQVKSCSAVYRTERRRSSFDIREDVTWVARTRRAMTGVVLEKLEIEMHKL
jgi:hypothetical protein